MPKLAKPLSARAVTALIHSGSGQYTRHAVGGVPGLLLHVSASGARSWVLRASLKGKRGEWGLGAFPEVPLAEAREKAIAARAAISEGVDPTRRERIRKGLTFADAVAEYCETKLDAYRNPKHKAQWRSTLEMYAVPELGQMEVGEITVQEIIRVLDPIWREKTETASRVRGRIEAVLAWATVHGFRKGDNPARWRNNLDKIFSAPDALKRQQNGGGDKRQPALQLDDSARWFAQLKTRKGLAARALEFQALTASRSGAVRLMTWSEVNFAARVWTIQPGRAASKVSRKPHRVPLTETMIALLRDAEKVRRNDYVFPAPRDGAFSDMGLAAVMKRIQERDSVGFLDPISGLPAVPHGLRSTFRNWAAERTEYPREMAEIALGHRIGSAVEQAYFRADMLEKRRAMMSEWGSFLAGSNRKAERLFVASAKEIIRQVEEIKIISQLPEENQSEAMEKLFRALNA
ncbi:tyrosine-type recombinase/integrase [Hyphomonas oceanitis]|uniref:Putative P4-family integrase n=1 Tax=Hyphomonas oceanitis SCH89 TaxID=1280953 RepID=A0A059G168_9PROT|nr:site-specific integrase [Hyphomonas oceanitis]KCZ97987.1 putative P4-family integrase [Hyphomonas oceanitis SCH89]